MYKYKIGYGTYEESEFCELTHKHYFKKEELSQLIAECISTLINKGIHIHSYQDIHRETIQILIKEYGFNQIKYDTKWMVFGWSSLFEERNFNDIEDEELNTIKKILKEKGYTIWNDHMHADECWTRSIIHQLTPDHYLKREYPSLYEILKERGAV